MLRRLFFFGLLGFWVAMNYLLWRHEVVGLDLGSPIDPEIVVQKILEAPDDSSLEIKHRDRRLGFCRWRPAINQLPAPPDSGEFAPEGIVNERLGYSLSLDGRFHVNPEVEQFHLNFSLDLDNEKTWRNVVLKFGLRRQSVELYANAATETVAVDVTDGDSRQSWSLAFSEILNLESVLSRIQWGGTNPLMGLGELISLKDLKQAVPRWEAWIGWLDVGHARMRVYRLRTRLLNRYEVTATISRVGEILMVELPNDVVLINEVLSHK